MSHLEGGPPIDIIPRPVDIKRGRSRFHIDSNTAIFVGAGNEEACGCAGYLVEQIRLFTGFVLDVMVSDKNDIKRPGIALELIGNPNRTEFEYYHLTVAVNEITIKACTPAGLFRGIQSLLQLIHVTGTRMWEPVIPEVEITDYASFMWRGMHLDVSRHYFPKEFIEKYIDLIAMYKMNIFHWHLTDDQGWRIEIKKYPKLTEIGAWRTEKDGSRYGGFYTQDEIREILEYAKTRYVTIVPEIDIPGHSLAALAAYPEYSCTGGPFEVANTWAIFDDVLCPGKEETFAFLQDILDEVIELFQCRLIHIGGDECPKTRWRGHALCRERMDRLGLDNEEQFQSYLINRVVKALRARDVTAIGWDEILEGGAPPESIVMAWRSMAYGLKALKSGNRVIMTPTSHCYFDYYQAEEGEPKAIGGYLPLEKVYSFNPIPADISADEIKLILGGQGNVWTEYMPDSNHVEYMLLPRLCAMAEALWSPISTRDFDDFKKRLQSHYPRFDFLDIFYRSHE